tara:strand:+ start:408 stop:695 length:288 start_codon:yes stop_codon:yes gene_type:complete
MAEQLENLIDLGQYPTNDVALIAREYMRHAYLETLEMYAKDYASLDEADEGRTAVLATLEAFEHTIAVLDGSEEFLESVHADPEEVSEDEEFERF